MFFRYIQMPRPFCFEPSNRYVVAIRFQRHGVSHRHLTAFILVDSVSWDCRLGSLIITQSAFDELSVLVKASLIKEAN